MKESNLLASVALFSELYNNKSYNNISDIIGEFIKSVVVSEKQWMINSTELTQLIEKNYNFNIPESVIRTTVKNRLKPKGYVYIKDGYYHFSSENLSSNYVDIDKDFEVIKQQQNAVVDGLVKFIESIEGNELSQEERGNVISNLSKYLLDNGVTEKYSKYISAFIIKNQANERFTENLNLIKEGVVLYQGIKYTADLNELGKWNTELNIYLSTEHLFNSVGYNGSLFQQIFDDFFCLVTEINASGKAKNGEKLIRLKYLEETKVEIDKFFQTAELILKGAFALENNRPAMKVILEGCKRPSDIVAKKALFEKELKLKGITFQDITHSIYDYPDYIVEDEALIKELNDESVSKGKPFDEMACRQAFSIFTKINYFRGGYSSAQFEKVGSIFVTANRFALYLAHSSKVKTEDNYIPFAKDIDFIINKFWFKLKKGLGNKATIPRTFDIVTKAQIIISSQLSQSVLHEYQRLQKQLKDGIITSEDALRLSYELREKPNRPEEVTTETIDKSLDFLLSDDYFEDVFREKAHQQNILSEALKAKKELENELNRINQIEQQRLAENRKREFESKQELYAEEKWQEYKEEQLGNLVYYMLVNFITALPILIGLVLKTIKPFNDWMESIGYWQILVWTILVSIATIELLGRSYLFNKERVKGGFLWLKLIFLKSSYDANKLEKLRQLKESFNHK